MAFDLMGDAREPDATLLSQRDALPNFRRLAESACEYRSSPELRDAVNVAISLGAPLLLTGEPGTGKTQAAWFVAWRFGIPKAAVFTLNVRSTSTFEDLTARFDAVSYLYAANDPHTKGLSRGSHVRLGPLAKAYQYDGPSVVLIDEVDKAPRDFPNDLLDVLDQHQFTVPETGECIRAPAHPPIIIITSNSERRLPEPFLRRCVVHHLELTPALVEAAIEAHRGAYLNLRPEQIDAARAQFDDLRAEGLRKAPSLGELLAWLAVLNALSLGPADARGRATLDAPNALARARFVELPALSVLIKDSEDLARLRGR